MINLAKIQTVLAIVIGIVLFSACTGNPRKTTGDSNGLNGHGGLPTDVLKCCTVSLDTFKSWYDSGKVVPNGKVINPSGVGLVHNFNCQFYVYDEQMFLWLTSPATHAGHENGLVFQSEGFYDVSPEGPDGKRHLTAHSSSGYIPRLASHINQNGPHRLPVFVDVNHIVWEVEKMSKNPAQKTMVKSAANGALVEVHSVEQSGSDYIFKDKAGVPIAGAKPYDPLHINSPRIAFEYKVGNKYIYKDINGKTINPLDPSEEGQATNDVLMSQGKSLVYYLIMVNDMYAYFLTARKNGYFASNALFPTDTTAMDSVCSYARLFNHNSNFRMADSAALAIELKTSWVMASSVPDPAAYVHMKAIVPHYNSIGDTVWVASGGEDTADLVMVGMHIVSSVSSHHEMVWATFEHTNNAPNAKYRYIDSAGQTRTVPQDTGTGWLLSNTSSGNVNNYNVSHMQIAGQNSAADSIKATKGDTISASNTMRSSPWGSSLDSVTNNQDSSSAKSNSLVISINNTVHGFIPDGDVRKNYLFIGATWTNKGTAPNDTSYHQGISSADNIGYAIGTSALANSTMETYIQFPGNSCFTCHSIGTPEFITHKRLAPTLSPDTLSHIFTAIQPLDSLLKKH